MCCLLSDTYRIVILAPFSFNFGYFNPHSVIAPNSGLWVIFQNNQISGVCVHACMRLCVCGVCVYTCCAHVHILACVSCIWMPRQEDDISLMPLRRPLISSGAGLMASKPQQSCPCLPQRWLGYSCAHSPFAWVLGIGTRVLGLVQKAC